MKEKGRLSLAFLYNVRHEYPDPENWESLKEADFDDPETIAFMRKWLEKYYDVLPIEADEEAYLRLYEKRDEIDLVFNYAEGKHGRDREAQIPAMLEMMRIPYTGSRPLTQALVLDKAMTKEVLRAKGIPVLPGVVMTKGQEEIGLEFPVIVKPLSQGSSAGITNESVVRDESELRRQVRKVLDLFGGSVLVEPFITGREFSVGMVGGWCLPVIEPDHQSLPEGFWHIDSTEVKWVLEEETGEDYLQCPAELSEEMVERIKNVCLATWEALMIEDVCRIDLRCDAEGNVYVLEVNSPAGLLPPEISQTSYLPLAARRAGLSYGDLLKWIVDTARERQKKNPSR